MKPKASEKDVLAALYPKRSKYGVSSKDKRTMDGIVFASKKEMMRYSELKLIEFAGDIKNLKLQPRFPLSIQEPKRAVSTLICTYIADFEFWDVKAAKLVIEDVKGMKTPEYRIKKKLFDVLYHPLKLTEV